MDLRYKLGLITHKYQLTHRNLADGYPHYINITRHNRTIKSQVGALHGHADVAWSLYLPSISLSYGRRCILLCPQVDYMEPIVDKITLVEDARFDSPKSMFLGRVMGKCLACHCGGMTCFFHHNLHSHRVCVLSQRSATSTMTSNGTTLRDSLDAYLA